MPPRRIAYLDGPRLRRSLVAACDHAQRQRAELNRINVFPVPDGDTGTNLALTVRAIYDHLRGNVDESVSGVARAAADGAVLGARGNCGMMLSHFLLGFSDGLVDRPRVDAAQFGVALRAGVDNLYRALERPVEGTILTVMRETAEEAEAAHEPDFEPLLVRLVERARSALARTPDLLPVLRTAGVVDAGAKGFVSLLEGALLLVHGDQVVALPPPPEPFAEAAAARAEMTERFRYCTEGMVRGLGLPSQDEVRGRLRHRGDSLIVIRSGELLKIHVHTDDPDDVFAYLRSLGDLVTHKAEDMRAQHAAVERAAGAHVQLARRPVAIVTDSACDLPEEVVRAHGIHVTPCVLIDGDRDLRDGIDITAVEFHDRLIAADGRLPTTSQPAPADFLETYARAAEDAESVVAVILGASLSGTFGSAQAAAARFHGVPIQLMDSKGASLLEGLLALKAAELAELAASPADIVRELTRIRAQSGILFTVDVFDRLLASGRVGRERAWLGTMLNVKPILELSREGTVTPVGKVLGRRRVIPAVMDALAERIPATASRVRFGIVHVAAPEAVEQVGEALRARWGRDIELLSAPATPVLATHLGPGAWGVAFLVED
ncbi:MAG: DegV family EDD domain-containing protein [Gemmatimonadetes bacterium]|nr:DegV family EDD domain-containing protein [Gemmatimonadota bacterium]